MIEKRLLRACLLGNDDPAEIQLWIRALSKHSSSIEFAVVDLTASDGLLKATESLFDLYITKPPGNSSKLKILYDERLTLLREFSTVPFYPSYWENMIYENKRMLYSWLKINGIPHPETSVFYSEIEALRFIESARFPIVAKTNIGASGSGVYVIKTKSEVRDYIFQTFSNTGAPKRWGPNFMKGDIVHRAFNVIRDHKALKKKIAHYKDMRSDKQIGFVLFQEYVPHNYEWRVVVIGDSYFAHKKLKIGEKASGSLLKNYDNPPVSLFDFVLPIIKCHNFYSQAVDLFELEDGNFLVNEMQCIFGQSDPYQMLVDGIPGRYFVQESNWHFEAGDFNTNESYDLRVNHIIKLWNESLLTR